MLAGLPLVEQGLCLLLRGGPGRVGVGAVVVLLLGDDEDVAHVHHVDVALFDRAGGIGIGVLIKIGADVGLGVGLRLDERLQVGGRRQIALDKVVVAGHGRGRAIGRLQIGVGAFVAVACRRDGDGIAQAVEIVLILLAELEAAQPRVLPEGGNALVGADGALQEILLPGERVVKDAHLLVKGLGGVDEIGGVGAVGAGEGIVLLPVVIRQIPVRQPVVAAACDLKVQDLVGQGLGVHGVAHAVAAGLGVFLAGLAVGLILRAGRLVVRLGIVRGIGGLGDRGVAGLVGVGGRLAGLDRQDQHERCGDDHGCRAEDPRQGGLFLLLRLRLLRVQRVLRLGVFAGDGKGKLFALLRVFLHGSAAGLFVHDVFHPSKFYGQHRRSARAQWTKLPVVSHKHTTSGRRLQSHGGRSDLNNY